MVKSYKTVQLGGEGEIVEKKSRFIATVEHVETEEEAVAFIERMKKKYWDARHNCSAYIIGKENSQMRCSDDGEPSGTAGRPMLDVIAGAGLCDICVVVTRYFGGVLLGTGGLVRAYSKSVQAGLESSILVENQLSKDFRLTCDYTFVGKLQYLVAQMGLQIADSVYTDVANLRVFVPLDMAEQFVAQTIELTNGQVQPQEEGEIYLVKEL